MTHEKCKESSICAEETQKNEQGIRRRFSWRQLS